MNSLISRASVTLFACNADRLTRYLLATVVSGSPAAVDSRMARRGPSPQPTQRDMKEFIQQFLEELQIRNYSERTIIDYGYHLNLWQKFLERKRVTELNRVTDATIADFQRWLFYLPTRHGAARGVLNRNTVLAAFKGFFRFLKDEGIIARDPAAALPYARQPSSLPRNVLTPEEANRILDRVDTTTPLGPPAFARRNCGVWSSAM
ncbi:MAG: tyrosine-type recombinase/integrase [Acidobacteriota bacterium]